MSERKKDEFLDSLNRARNLGSGMDEFQNLLIDDDKQNKETGLRFAPQRNNTSRKIAKYRLRNERNNNINFTSNDYISKRQESSSIYSSEQEIPNELNNKYSDDFPNYHSKNQTLEYPENTEDVELTRVSGNPYLDDYKDLVASDIEARKYREIYNYQNINNDNSDRYLFTTSSSGKKELLHKRSFFAQLISFFRILKYSFFIIIILLITISIYLWNKGYTLDKIQSLITIERSTTIDKELQSLARRNIDSIDFVLSLANSKDGVGTNTIDAVSSNDSTSVKRMKDRDVQSYLNEENKIRTIKYFSTFDLHWASSEYGGDYFALTASGPTVLSMILVNEGRKIFTPTYIAKFMSDNSYTDDISYMSETGLMDFSSRYSLVCKKISADFDTVRAYLAEGNKIIVKLKGNSPARREIDFEHYAIIDACYENLYVSLIDPQHRKDSENKITFSSIKDKIVAIYSISI